MEMRSFPQMISKKGKTDCKTSRSAFEADLLVFYVLLLRFQVLHGGIHQLQLLLRGAGQLLDGFQRLFCLKFCKLMGKFLLCLL